MKINKNIKIDKMTDTYLQNQNISNNIIFNKPKDNIHGKKSLKNKDNNESYSSSNEERNETIDNKINDSSTLLDIEEVPPPDQDIDHLQQFNKENKNIYYLNYQNKTNSLSRNKNNVKIMAKKMNSLTSQHHLNRAISGNIIPLPKNTNFILGNNNNNNIGINGYKRGINGERNTVKQTESRFSSSSENKDNFFYRKTILNPPSEIQNNINNFSPISSQRKNFPVLTAKVIKLSTKSPSQKNMINKKLSSKINEHYKNNNFYSVNNYLINSYKNLNLSPSNHKSNVKIIIKKSIDNRQSNTVNDIYNSNNINISGEKSKENKNFVNNNSKEQDNMGSNSSKNKGKIINIQKVSNFEITDGNNRVGYYQKNKIDNNMNKINPKNIRNISNENQKRLTKSPQNLNNIRSLNKNINDNQRLTVTYHLSPKNGKQYKNPNIMKFEQYQQLSPIKTKQQINVDQTLKCHSQSNSPKGATVTKLPPLNNNINNLINNHNINEMNRQSVNPKQNNLETQEIEIINEPLDNRSKKKKSIKNADYYNKNTYNYNTNINNIRNINNIININNMNKTKIINNDENMNNLKNSNNIHMHKMKNSYSMSNINDFNTINNKNINLSNNINNTNNQKIMNNINNNMNIVNNNMNLKNTNKNNINILNNIGIINHNNVSRNPNFKNNLNNINPNFKTNPQISNKLNINPLINGQESKINPSINQERNTIAKNFIPQEFNQSNPKPIMNQIQIIQPQNNFSSPPISKIPKESQRLTQIPNNLQKIKNPIYPQNEVFNHPPINYQSPQNQMLYLQKENQLYNNIQNNNINLKNQKNIFNNEKQTNELIGEKDVDVIYNKFDPSGWLKNYGILTLPGKDESGSQKTNQDSFVFKKNINKIKDFNIFGVLDGHGPEGHYVSKFTSEFIPSLLSNHPQIKCLSDPEQIYKKLKDNNCKIITQTFIEADNQLKKASFDASESGCTCVLIIHVGSHIICANTGDSRAIVVHDGKGENNINNFKGVPLSIDYKPEIPEETNRIIMNGGIVRKMKNELGEGVGPYRVWARDGDYPGLAMSRSIGDLKGKHLGIIPDPGILEYDLCDKSKYIVVCSDGVWEFLSNENVKDIGKKYYIENNPSGFCHELINQSLNLWELNDIVVDDITAVVAFF